MAMILSADVFVDGRLEMPNVFAVPFPQMAYNVQHIFFRNMALRAMNAGPRPVEAPTVGCSVHPVGPPNLLIDTNMGCVAVISVSSGIGENRRREYRITRSCMSRKV